MRRDLAPIEGQGKGQGDYSISLLWRPLCSIKRSNKVVLGILVFRKEAQKGIVVDRASAGSDEIPDLLLRHLLRETPHRSI